MASNDSRNDPSVLQAQIDAIRAQLTRYEEDEAATEQELATFDALDYDDFSSRNWDRLHESHAADIMVYSGQMVIKPRGSSSISKIWMRCLCMPRTPISRCIRSGLDVTDSPASRVS